MKQLSYFLMTIAILSCAQVTSLNLKKHQFGKIPTKIIWFQVAGLTQEHLSLLKFGYNSYSQITAFEESLCVGSTWEYNLFDLRPQAKNSFLAELTGKANIKNTCSDYQIKPIWDYLTNQNYKVGIFEGEVSAKDALTNADTCSTEKAKSYLDPVIYWSMTRRPNKEAKLFHINEEAKFIKGSRYYDKSCMSGKCYTHLSRNIEKTYVSFQKNAGNYLYLVRNFNYLKAIKDRNFKKALSELNEINIALKFFQGIAAKNSDMLVLVTTAEGQNIDLPRSGAGWKNFEKRTKFLKNSHSKLVSNVFASGARAENFCGMYEQNDILKRMFSGAKQQGLEFSIINPFDF